VKFFQLETIVTGITEIQLGVSFKLLAMIQSEIASKSELLEKI